MRIDPAALEKARADMEAFRKRYGAPLVGMAMNNKALEWVKAHAETTPTPEQMGVQVLVDPRLPDGKIEYCHDPKAWAARKKEQAKYDAAKAKDSGPA